MTTITLKPGHEWRMWCDRGEGRTQREPPIGMRWVRYALMDNGIVVGMFCDDEQMAAVSLEEKFKK